MRTLLGTSPKGRITGRHFAALTAILMTLLLATSLTGGRLPALGWPLVIADLLGWAAYFILLLLFFLPLQGRPPRRAALGYGLHRAAGYGAIGLALTHAVAALAGEPETLDYLLPGAPIYMLAALVALPVGLGVCLSGENKGRRWLNAAPGGFRILHLAAGVFLIALSWGHCAGSAGLPATTARLAPWAVLSAAACWTVAVKPSKTKQP